MFHVERSGGVPPRRRPSCRDRPVLTGPRPQPAAPASASRASTASFS